MAAAKSIVNRVVDYFGLKDTTARLREIPRLVAELERDARRIENLPDAIDEQIAAEFARIDAAGAAGRKFIGDLRLGRERVPFAILDQHVISLEAVDQYSCAHFPEPIKKIRADWIRAGATGDEMPASEKAAKRAQIAATIAALWKEFLELVDALEAEGVEVDLDANVPVAEFLGFNPSTKDIRADRLDMIRRRRHAFNGQREAIETERQQVSMELGAAEANLRNWEASATPVLRKDLEAVKQNVVLSQEKLAAVNKKHSELTAKMSPTLKLLGNCEAFLRSHGVGVKPGTAELMR